MIRLYRGLVSAALVLMLALIALSAYIRLSNSGFGCAEWPACFGQLEPPVDQAPSWAAGAHRLIAAALALLVLAINAVALRARHNGTPFASSLAALFVLIALAVLGVASGGLRIPAVVMANLLGGFGMLGLLWWLLLATGRRDSGPPALPRAWRPWIWAALILLIAQIVLGALTSARFAAFACPVWPGCSGDAPSWTALTDSFRIFQPLRLDAQGKVLVDAAAVAAHHAHRIGALITVVCLGALAIAAFRSRYYSSRLAAALLLLLLADAGLGIVSVASKGSLLAATLHNLLAALLLLSLLSLLHRAASRRAKRAL